MESWIRPQAITCPPALYKIHCVWGLATQQHIQRFTKLVRHVGFSFPPIRIAGPCKWNRWRCFLLSRSIYCATPILHQYWPLVVEAAFHYFRLRALIPPATWKPFNCRCWGLNLELSADQAGGLPQSYNTSRHSQSIVLRFVCWTTHLSASQDLVLVPTTHTWSWVCLLFKTPSLMSSNILGSLRAKILMCSLI